MMFFSYKQYLKTNYSNYTEKISFQFAILTFFLEWHDNRLLLHEIRKQIKSINNYGKE